MNAKLRGISGVNEVQEQRLWKSLDSIGERLSGIEDKLTEVVRLEERVNNHGRSLDKYGRRLDDHDERIRDAEIKQANAGDGAILNKLIEDLKIEIGLLKVRINEVEKTKDISKGQKDIGKEVLKWVATIAIGVLVYKLTKG